MHRYKPSYYIRKNTGHIELDCNLLANLCALIFIAFNTTIVLRMGTHCHKKYLYTYWKIRINLYQLINIIYIILIRIWHSMHIIKYTRIVYKPQIIEKYVDWWCQKTSNPNDPTLQSPLGLHFIELHSWITYFIVCIMNCWHITISITPHNSIWPCNYSQCIIIRDSFLRNISSHMEITAVRTSSDFWKFLISSMWHITVHSGPSRILLETYQSQGLVL